MAFRELRSIGPRRPISSAAAKRIEWLKFVKSGMLSFFRSTQTHGYRFIVMPHRPKYEMIFWIITLVTISTFTLWMILHVYIPVLSKPTVTTQQPFWQSVRHVPFPTIALCNTNRISREALMNYSDFMWVLWKYQINFIPLFLWLMFAVLRNRKDIQSIWARQEMKCTKNYDHWVLSIKQFRRHPIYTKWMKYTQHCWKFTTERIRCDKLWIM